MLRSFNDEKGNQWRVWDVNPVLHGHSSAPIASARSAAQRGWLCFESGSERRRLAPIPVGWTECDAAALRDLCGRAEPVQRPFAKRPPAEDA